MGISAITLIIEASNGIFIGSFLLYVGLKKKSLLFLGFFMLALGISSISEILSDFGTYIDCSKCRFLPFGFFLLFPGLFYLYVQDNSIRENKKKNYWVLVPGFIEFFFGLIFYILLSENQLAELYGSKWITYVDFFGMLFTILLLFFILRKIKAHDKAVLDQYSQTKFKKLTWAYYFILAMILTFALVIPIMSVYVDFFYGDLIISILSLFFMYWVSFRALLQLNSENLFSKLPELHKKSTVSLHEKTDLLYGKIEEIMKQEALYLNPSLNIIELSEKVGEHPRLVSRTINLMSNSHFNSYVNSFRVEKAANMLMNQKHRDLNIEGIGLESGFKSNSSFYLAFKKRFGCTPNEYAKNVHRTRGDSFVGL